MRFMPSAVSAVQATPLKATSRYWAANDNFIATISYADGSVASLTYTALGNKAHPKERMDVYCDGKVLLLADYKRLSTVGRPAKSWASRSQNKGQFEELKAFVDGLKSGDWPISLEDQLSASRVSFEVEKRLRI
jgi:hypothetical protein